MKLLWMRVVMIVVLGVFFTAWNVTFAQQESVTKSLKSVTPSISDDGAKMVRDSSTNDNRHDVGSSLYYTVRRGGPIMVPIILCGIVALTLIIERIIFFTKNRRWNSAHLELFLQEVSKKSKAHYREEKADELREAFQQYLNQMERGLVFLQGIGSFAPLLGFLGTVTGMITAFSAIAAATTVNARIVAVGIQEALITTAGGLFVAAPSTFFYYLFLHVIHQRMGQAEEIIEMLCADLPRITEKMEPSIACEDSK
ncbi:MAG: MotA/TolQ/ExbB proton channel family protein [Spirochaetes bacterium]|nr:MotA/TolQ/ExbB proton channel family protein [Spirochaetota bacterium]